MRSIVLGSAPAALLALLLALPSAAAPPDTTLVRIASGAGATDMFVAWPATRESAPGIVVVHEWWGMNAQIRDVARRFAGQGYVAVVPDLYHGRVASDPEAAHELSRGLEDDSTLTDLRAAVAWLRAAENPGRKVGVVGFCMGGRLSQLLAIESGDIAAAVMFYGRPISDAASLGKLKAPLQGHFGAADKGIPVQRVKELESALARAGKRAQVFVYPGAGHAFMNDARPSHNPDSARLAWARMLSFLQKHLKETR